MINKSKAALSNEHLLYGVNIVVYVEGGKDSNQKDKIKKEYANSIDIHYWQSLFEVYKPKIKCHFKSNGSKKNIKEIAKQILKGATNVVVAMDRDFDNIKNKQIKNNNILYTYGYSWENDAWNEDSLIELLKDYSTTLKDEKKIHDSFKNLFSDLKKYILADLKLVSNGNKAFFDRNNYTQYIILSKSQKNEPPKINKKILNDSFVKRKNINKNKISYNVSLLDCFGHLLSSYAYHLLIHIRNKKENLSKCDANRYIVNSFCKILIDESKLSYIRNHYKNEFSRIEVR